MGARDTVEASIQDTLSFFFISGVGKVEVEVDDIFNAWSVTRWFVLAVTLTSDPPVVRVVTQSQGFF